MTKKRVQIVKSPPEWGIEPVPPKYQILGFFDYFVLWGDLGMGLLVLLAGSFLAPGLGFFQAFAAIVIGSFVGCILLAAVGLMGSRTHAPTMVLLRSVLGIRGSWLPSFFNVIQLIGWTIFEFVVMGMTAVAILKSLFGFGNYYTSVMMFAFLVILMGIGGVTAVVRKWLRKYAVWIVTLTTAWLTYHIFAGNNISTLLRKAGDGSLSFWSGVDIVIAMPISWLPLIADFNRFAKNDRHAFWGSFWGYFLSNIWLYTIGAVILMTTSVTQETIGFIQAVLLSAGSLALLILLVDETKEAWADLYSSAVSTQNIFPHIKQRTLIIFLGIFSLISAMFIDITQYENFLYIIGSIFIPLFAILIADYFFIHKGNIATKELYSKHGLYWFSKGINWLAMLSWAFGILVYQFITRKLPDLGASLPTFVCVFIVYLLFMKLRVIFNEN